MHILKIYVHISTRYEVSMSNVVTATAVHRQQHQWWWQQWWWYQWWWQQHKTDKSWLHRLIGMYAKWAKKMEFQNDLHVVVIYQGTVTNRVIFCSVWDKKNPEAWKSLVFEKTLLWIWNKCKLLFLLGWKYSIHVLLYTIVQDEACIIVESGGC